MPKYTIPDVFIPGFDAIATLTDKDLQTILSKVELLKIGDGPDSLSSILNDIEIAHNTDVHAISITLFSLINLICEDEVQDESIESFLEDLISSFREQVASKKIFHLKNLKKNLSTLLVNKEKISLTIKALKLNIEFDKIYSKSHISTDIRVIFHQKIEKDEQVAIIIHNLQIEYKKNDLNKKLFVTLDGADLRNLKEQIDRAIEKEASLKKTDKISFIEIKS